MRPADAPSRSVQAAPAAPPSAVLAAVGEHARRRGGAAAAVTIGADGEPGPPLTYAVLAAAARRLSGAIAAAAVPGEVVMLAGPSDAAYVAWFCAGLAAGVRVLPLPPRLVEAEVAELARRSGARAVIAGGGDGACPRSLRRIDRALAHAGAPAQSHGLGGGRGGGAVVLHTSGTTGEGSLAQRDSAALDADGANVVEAARLTSVDRLLATVPLSHSYGVDMLAATLLAGATLEIVPAFDAAAVARRLRGGATVFPAVPFMIEALGSAGPGMPGAGGRPRLVFSAGGVLPAATRAAFERAWGVRVGDLYGASELGSVTFNDPGSPEFGPGSVGRPMRGVNIRIVDPEEPARALPIGRTGHIAVRAPSMLSAYLDGEPALRDGHWLTGDLGHLDAAGRLFVTGRLKLLIDTGGAKVNPLEVEAALARHPGVAECVVVPLPLSPTVTRLRAVFVGREGVPAPTPEEARAFLKRTLSPDKVPRVFERVGSLPKSPTGKVLRRALTGE